MFDIYTIGNESHINTQSENLESWVLLPIVVNAFKKE